MGSLVLTGNTSGSVTVAVPDVAGSNTATIGAATGTHYPFTAATAVASTSGTSIDFTSIPSWVKRITVLLSGVSTNGTSNPIIQLGTSGGVQTTSYSGSLWTANTTNNLNSTGFLISGSAGASNILESVITLCLFNSATGLWVASVITSRSDAATSNVGSGSKTLSGTLDRIRITTVNGTDTFDAGSINILYE